MILMLKSLCLKFVLNLIMKKLIFFIPIIIFAFLFLFTNTIYAQYGTYTCFGSGSTGGCRLGTSNCTNGGQIPNPSGCNGLQPAQCNSASFGCVSPSSCGTQGQTCVNAGNCCSGYNCIGSVCVSAPGNPNPPDQPPIGPEIVSCNGVDGIETAIGCIPISEEQALAKFFLKWGMGIAAGIALVLISFSGYQIMTASGDPRKLQAGKELLTAAVTGVVLLALTAFILRVIGVNILGIF